MYMDGWLTTLAKKKKYMHIWIHWAGASLINYFIKRLKYQLLNIQNDVLGTACTVFVGLSQFLGAICLQGIVHGWLVHYLDKEKLALIESTY